MIGYCSFYLEAGRVGENRSHPPPGALRMGCGSDRLVAALEGGRGELGEKHLCGALGRQVSQREARSHDHPRGRSTPQGSGHTRDHQGSVFLRGFAREAEILYGTETLDCIFWNCTIIPRLGRGSVMPLPQSTPQGVPRSPLQPSVGPPCPSSRQ